MASSMEKDQRQQWSLFGRLVLSPGWCLEEDQISQELPSRALFALLSPLDPAGDHTASL